MAALARPSLREKGRSLMSKRPRPASTSVAANAKPAPVRVRLKRINCDYARPYPPEGQACEWWQRLKHALGTASSAFVDASLQQLIAAARLPFSGISETAVNASLAFIEGAKPQTRWSVPSSSKWPVPIPRPWRCWEGSAGRTVPIAAAARLLRAYATQVEALRRLRHGSSQLVRVDHVHVNEGGQAVIGAVAVEDRSASA